MGKRNIIGYKTAEIKNRLYVVEVWCLLCRKHEQAIKISPACRGPARKAMLSYVHGTSYVSKCNVTRHLTGKAHQVAIEADQSCPLEQRILKNSAVVSSGPKQTRIMVSMETAAQEAYYKMFTTAYELARNPLMPLSHFRVLIKCQRQNGIRLVKGKDDGRACKEFVHYTANAIRGKVAAVIGSTVSSMLSDGSQARKMKSEKELVMVRTERSGIPVYLVASLLEISEYGGTGANSIKKGIDDTFLNKLSLEDDQYQFSCISSTADGASVNFGKYAGVLTQYKKHACGCSKFIVLTTELN